MTPLDVSFRTYFSPLSGPDVEGLTLPEVSLVTGQDAEIELELESSTPDITSSSVTDSSLATPSLPGVTEQDRGGPGAGEEDGADDLLLGRSSAGNCIGSGEPHTLLVLMDS